MVVTMDKGIRADFEFEGELNGLLNDTLGSLIPSSSAADSSKKSTQPFKQTMKTNGPTAEGLPKKKIMRPGKIRIGADFKPFENNYLILSPFLAFPFINAEYQSLRFGSFRYRTSRIRMSLYNGKF